MVKMKGILPKKIVDKLEQGEELEYFSPDYGNLSLSMDLFNDFIKHEVDLSPNSIKIPCPVRIIHGIQVST